ncbi:hypothetical protein BDV40DRAFT_265738 [Aspergillus tamarii]|uniref:Uncharacterized protein n=1 Tax=Aspergillus tamarii TaxID=41984 RepID=A0A5N6UUQ5_ASPTM|nr:hypothetical protein BDV40DRAFT_265738 [Aspergillus tamarii]
MRARNLISVPIFGLNFILPYTVQRYDNSDYHHLTVSTGFRFCMLSRKMYWFPRIYQEFNDIYMTHAS